MDPGEEATRVIRSLLGFISSSLLGLGSVSQLPYLKQDDGGARLLCTQFGTLALATAMLNPSVYRRIDRVVGLPNITRLPAHTVVCAAGWMIREYLHYLEETDPGSRDFPSEPIRNALITMAVMNSSYLLGLKQLGSANHSAPLTFTKDFEDNLGMTLHWMAFMGYLGVTMQRVARAAHAHANRSKGRRRWLLRWGLHCTSVGGAAGTVYAYGKIAYLSGNTLGLRPPVHPDKATDLLKGISITLVLLGCSVPYWSTFRPVRNLPDRLADYVSLKRLQWLADEIYRVLPGLQLEASPLLRQRAEERKRSASWRLNRMSLEILDGYALVRDYVDARAVLIANEICRERGLDARQTEIEIEATSLRIGLSNRHTGFIPQEVDGSTLTPKFRSFDERIEHLETIAAVAHKSDIPDIVSRTLEEMDWHYRSNQTAPTLSNTA